MIELLVFLLGSLGIIYLSRVALTRRYTHGFPRFFAFEALLGLVVLNASHWFIKPFSLAQIISWLLLFVSIPPAIYSFWSLHAYGATDRNTIDSNRIGFEKTTRLVTVGPYRFIRHPMYASLLCLAWGVFLKQITLLTILLAFLASLSFYMTAVYEERENLRTFGEEYAAYMQATKRFIPFVF